MDVALKHPFSMLVAGSRNSGKTVFTKELLKHKKRLLDPTPTRIVWCYSKHQLELFYELQQIDQDIEYIEGIPSSINTTMFNSETRSIVVIDDMMDEAGTDVTKLFTKGRHDNVSVVFLTQNLFHKTQRNMSLNSDYIVIFKNPRDKSQFTNFAKQFMPRKTNFLQWAYEDATLKPYSYLFLDLTADTDERYRVRAEVLKDIQYVYIPS